MAAGMRSSDPPGDGSSLLPDGASLPTAGASPSGRGASEVSLATAAIAAAGEIDCTPKSTLEMVALDCVEQIAVP
jgi:hypothetical protein